MIKNCQNDLIPTTGLIFISDSRSSHQLPLRPRLPSVPPHVEEGVGAATVVVKALNAEGVTVHGVDGTADAVVVGSKVALKG